MPAATKSVSCPQLLLLSGWLPQPLFSGSTAIFDCFNFECFLHAALASQNWKACLRQWRFQVGIDYTLICIGIPTQVRYYIDVSLSVLGTYGITVLWKVLYILQVLSFSEQLSIGIVSEKLGDVRHRGSFFLEATASLHPCMLSARREYRMQKHNICCSQSMKGDGRQVYYLLPKNIAASHRVILKGRLALGTT